MRVRIRRFLAVAAAAALGACSSGPAPETTLIEPASIVGPTAIDPGLSAVTVPDLTGSETTSADPVSGAPSGAEPVRVEDCVGCTVLATTADVLPGLSAVLITAEGRAGIVSINAERQVQGALNVPYGASFAGGADQLVCADARCVVVAAQQDGTAILSAFEMAADGSWRDLSGDTGFVSATSAGRPVEVGGELGIAVQVTDGSTTAWMVFTPTADGYDVAGCTPDVDPPAFDAPTADTCPS